MKILKSLAVVVLCALACKVTVTFAGSRSEKDREALQKTGDAIRGAFARGDLATIMAYHHPDVIKALGFHRYLAGRDAAEADLRSALQQSHLEFEENRLESLLIQGDIAVEQSIFTIKSTPKSGGEPVWFMGRTQVVYIRYKQSPSGWALIREIIQPATD